MVDASGPDAAGPAGTRHGGLGRVTDDGRVTHDGSVTAFLELEWRTDFDDRGNEWFRIEWADDGRWWLDRSVIGPAVLQMCQPICPFRPIRTNAEAQLRSREAVP